jgi:transcriptional accessory protein Tex/SPT6
MKTQSAALQMNTSEKKCHECEKPLKGRVDKKFCDDFCRNSYNNKLNSDTNGYVRNINNALRKNRRILEEALPANEEMAKITRSKMLEKGFQFKYLTHTYTNKKGNIYYFCYEYGYLLLEGDWILVVKRKEAGAYSSGNIN